MSAEASTLFPSDGLLGRLGVDPLIQEARDRQWRRRRRWLAFLILASFLSFGAIRYSLAADIPQASAAPLPPPCKLLTNAEVAHALGLKIEMRTPQPFTCTWQTVPFGNFTSTNRSLQIQEAHLTKAKFERFGTQNPRNPLISYKGIGELAYLEPDGNGSYTLLVWQHGVYLQLAADEVASPLATEQALALIILKHAAG
jgi:hypothetical protein